MFNRHIPHVKILLCMFFILLACAVVFTVIYAASSSKIDDGYVADLTTDFSGGDGSASDPYRISSLDDLVALSELIKDRDDYKKNSSGSKNEKEKNKPQYSEAYLKYSLAHYIQTADIDASPVERWKPIGSSRERPFVGVYDGGGYKVSNIRYGGAATGRSDGLFGYVAGLVRRVNVENMNEHTLYYQQDLGSSIGMIAGSLVRSTIVFDGERVVNNSTLNRRGIGQGIIEYCSSSGFFNLELNSSKGMSMKDIVESIDAWFAGKRVMKGIAIGGIVGNIMDGFIGNSENSTVLNIYHDFREAFKPDGRDRYSVGGVVGKFSGNDGMVLWCRNDGNILVSAREASAGLVSVSMAVGGIAGISSHVLHSLNTGAINIEGGSYLRRAMIGGIAGEVLMDGGVTSSVNKGSLFVNPSEAWMIGAGGIVADMGGSGIVLSNNSGHIQARVQFVNKRFATDGGSSEGYETAARIFCGGIIAVGTNSGRLTDVSNTGNISIHSVIEGVKSKTYAGGIGGEVPSSLSNALNVGLINIEAVSPNTECSVGYIVGSVSNNSSRLINSYWLDIPGGALGIAGIGYDRREGENNDSIKGLSPEEASDISNYPGWDFKGRWEIPASGSQLPRLRSESDAGKYNEEEWKLLWN